VTRVLGAVLAGGRSSRFGSNKAAALWQAQPLADHAAAALAGYVDAVVQVGAGLDVADLPVPGLGPLGGIAGALAYGAANGFANVVTIACDMPQLPEGLVAALMRHAPAFCMDAPVLGHWPAALVDQLVAHLVQGEDRSVRGWARAIGALPVPSPAPIANINTPADLVAL
jgi:molybdopterin-guanine dinucleotide biosynthesis protein A